MKSSALYGKEITKVNSNDGNGFLATTANSSECKISSVKLIRFEEKKERYIWAHPDEICFIKSADHYVKSLIKSENQMKWMSRHCTIKELLFILPVNNFIRLNKFYLLNRIHFSYINEIEKILYLNEDFSIPIPHRISRYVLDLIKK